MKRNEIRAFVLEDESILAKVIQRSLEISGIRDIDISLHQEDAENLLLKTPKKNYNIMVLDTDCPEPGYGPRILKLARSLSYDIDLVIASSGNQENKRLWVGESKVDKFFLKPYTIKDLIDAVKEKFPEA